MRSLESKIKTDGILLICFDSSDYVFVASRANRFPLSIPTPTPSGIALPTGIITLDGLLISSAPEIVF